MVPPPTAATVSVSSASWPGCVRATPSVIAACILASRAGALLKKYDTPFECDEHGGMDGYGTKNGDFHIRSMKYFPSLLFCFV